MSDQNRNWDLYLEDSTKPDGWRLVQKDVAKNWLQSWIISIDSPDSPMRVKKKVVDPQGNEIFLEIGERLQ